MPLAQMLQKHMTLLKQRKLKVTMSFILAKNHPEPEGAVGIAPDIVHLIERADDLKTLEIPTDKILVTNQTTMSQWDVQHLMEDIQKKFPTAEFHKEICLATQVRQKRLPNKLMLQT